jgi:hypothetical protein
MRLLWGKPLWPQLSFIHTTIHPHNQRGNLVNKSIFRGYKAKALAIAVSAVTAGLVVTPALYAQDQVEEIQVTGSRVRVTDGMAAPTPVTAITFGELQNFDPGGTIAEQLDSLPQFFGTQTAQRGGGAFGHVFTKSFVGT